MSPRDPDFLSRLKPRTIVMSWISVVTICRLYLER
jgi:hypothetical protein